MLSQPLQHPARFKKSRVSARRTICLCLVACGLALVPLRDLIAFWVWFASFAGHQVHWRGDIFILENGKIRPVDSEAPAVVSAAEPERDKVSAHW